MAKSKSSKRKRTAQADTSQKLQKTITPPPEAGIKSLQSVVSAEELETTIETLNLLAQYPGLAKSKACREVRGAVWGFRSACDGASETNLTGRVTAALADGKYLDARILLAEMRVRVERPKLGALCRWVRDLDVVSGLSGRVGAGGVVVERSERDKNLLVVLDAVLRVAGPVDVGLEGLISAPAPIVVQEVWDLHQGKESRHQVYDGVVEKWIFKCLQGVIEESFRVVENTPGPLRKPPNRHPAILHASKDDTVDLYGPPPVSRVRHHPRVPNLSLIENVLDSAECIKIVAAAEKIGFSPDCPVSGGESEESSVLAHNFYWVVDEAFCGKLWQRVRPFVPEHIAGRKVRGLNRRFRVYRYVPGAEYRCHIDGAWPPSGIHPVSKAYIYDSSPPEARQSSLFTFLIYLNDEFEGGETTFFMPSAREGVLNAYPIRPLMGGVAMFPHGETAGALLHEGTGVKKGAKYVIRTDVLYDVDATV